MSSRIDGFFRPRITVTYMHHFMAHAEWIVDLFAPIVLINLGAGEGGQLQARTRVSILNLVRKKHEQSDFSFSNAVAQKLSASSASALNEVLSFGLLRHVAFKCLILHVSRI